MVQTILYNHTFTTLQHYWFTCQSLFSKYVHLHLYQRLWACEQCWLNDTKLKHSEKIIETNETTLYGVKLSPKENQPPEGPSIKLLL